MKKLYYTLGVIGLLYLGGLLALSPLLYGGSPQPLGWPYYVIRIWYAITGTPNW